MSAYGQLDGVQEDGVCRSRTESVIIIAKERRAPSQGHTHARRTWRSLFARGPAGTLSAIGPASDRIFRAAPAKIKMLE